MKTAKNLLAAVTAVCLLIVLFFTAMQLSIFNMDYIDREMNKYSRAEYLGMSEEDLHELFDQTLKYLSDDREDLVIETVVNGQPREAYDEREKLHMVDVKKLFDRGFFLRNLCAGLLIGCLFLWILIKVKKGTVARELSRAVWVTFLVFLAVFSVLMVYVVTHFDTAFIRFHQIFFDNDLWMLDPDVSLMINMLPEEFFYDMAVRIGAFFLIPFILILAAAFLIWHRSRSHQKPVFRTGVGV